MNRRLQLVLQVLKPKAKSLGFNAAELQSVAKRIADNLATDDDADEEAIKQEAETAVDLALPYLEMAQKNANRIIEEQRKKNKPKTAPKKEEDDEDEDEPADNTPSYVKALLKKMESMEARMEGLNADRLNSTRKAQLEQIVKDAGVYGKRILKDFEGRNFENEDAYEAYLEEVKTDCEAFNQEMANAGLSGMVNAGGGRSGNGGNKKELSDTEVDDLVSTF